MKRFSLIFFGILLLAACRKVDEYPNIPALSYKSVTFSSNSLGQFFTLTATVTDGDGDIGYKDDESNGDFDNSDLTKNPYYYNFVITLEYLDNQVWKEYKVVQQTNDSLPPD